MIRLTRDSRPVIPNLSDRLRGHLKHLFQSKLTYEDCFSWAVMSLVGLPDPDLGGRPTEGGKLVHFFWSESVDKSLSYGRRIRQSLTYSKKLILRLCSGFGTVFLMRILCHLFGSLRFNLNRARSAESKTERMIYCDLTYACTTKRVCLLRCKATFQEDIP